MALAGGRVAGSDGYPRRNSVSTAVLSLSAPRLYLLGSGGPVRERGSSPAARTCRCPRAFGQRPPVLARGLGTTTALEDQRLAGTQHPQRASRIPSERLASLRTMSFAFVDLFSGIGGFHAALDSIGGELVFASDIDAAARTAYRQNWLGDAGDDLLHGDLRPLTERNCGSIPVHEVLTGGFPCQPFSKSGRQLGVQDARGTLFYNILKILQARRPSVVVLENVRNLVGPKHHADYLQMIQMLRSLGYAVSTEPVILSPHEVPPESGGTPQHRERVFIVGIHVGRRRAQALDDLPPVIPRHAFRREWDPRSWDLAAFLRDQEQLSSLGKADRSALAVAPDVRHAIAAWSELVEAFTPAGGLPDLPSFPLWTEYWKPRRRLRLPGDVPAWKRKLILKNVVWYEAFATYLDPWRRRTDLDSLQPSLRKFEWQARRSATVEACVIQARPSGVRVKNADYAPALVAIAQTPILGWEGRELSLGEAAALQGFSPDFDFSGQTRGTSLRQLGNAVHVGCARLVTRSAFVRASDLGVDVPVDDAPPNCPAELA